MGVFMCFGFWLFLFNDDLVAFAIVDHLQIDKEIERSKLSINCWIRIHLASAI